jgi:predicted outer membrane repeat protein
MAVQADSTCTLPEAVVAVNTLAAYNGCPAANGSNDTITLPAGQLTESAGLIMTVQRSVRIVGQRRASTVIETSAFWGFTVNGTASVHLQLANLTLRQRTQTNPVVALNVDAGSVTLDNVRIADYGLGGIWMKGEELDVLNSLIENNQTDGMSVRGAQLFVSGSTIRNNKFSGIYVETDSNEIDATIEGSTIENNQESGLLVHGAQLLVSGSTIRNNKLSGIQVHPGSNTVYAKIERSTIENNTGSQGAGLWMDGSSGGQLSVSNSLFSNNQATGAGGGVYSDAQPIFSNVTFNGNRAAKGGGFYHGGAESYIYNCTFADNTATERGGGVYALGGRKIYSHSIFAFNQAPLNPDIEAQVINGNYNLVRNTAGYETASGEHANDITNQDPKLGTLQSLGGPTRVRPLLFQSPAIDRIPAGTVDLQATDQRGTPRPQDGDDGAGRTGADMGAFEQGPFEAEFLTMAAKTDGVPHSLITNDSGFSAQGGTRFHAQVDGRYVTYAVPILEAGNYTFSIRVRRGGDRGIYQVATADSLGGAYTNRGLAQDLYRSTTDSQNLTLGGATVNFATTGTKYVRFTVTGKNNSSSSRNLYLDYVQLKKQ